MSEVDIDNYYTDDEIKDHLREDREEQERLEAEKESFFDEDDLIFDDEEGNESEDDYSQDSLIEQYDLPDDEFEGEYE
nr:MAG TPA: hypothetical protein [Bacteriophage sp.]